MFRDFTFIRSVLMPDEKVVFATSLHWVVYLRGLMMTLLGGALALWGNKGLAFVLDGALLEQAMRPMAYLALVVSVIGCFQMVMAGLRQSGTELVVTNRRVVAKFGIVSRVTYELLLNKIEGANLEQSAQGRMLGYGTIIVRGVGTNLAPIEWVDSPSQFQNALLGQVNRQERAVAAGRKS